MPCICDPEGGNSRARELQVRNIRVSGAPLSWCCRNRCFRTPLAWTAKPRRAIPAPMKKGDHLFLVDGSGYIFRAYHALPPLTRKSDGLPVGAVAGFCNMLWKLMVD